MSRKSKDKSGNRAKGRLVIRLVKTLIFVLFILIAIFLTIHLFFPNIHFTLPFIYNKKLSSTESILKDIKKVSTLSTVEYIYKSVFPFDFFEPDTDWRNLLLKRAKGSQLSTSEEEELWIFDLCRTIGINLEHKNYNFVVITSLVEAGLNLGSDINPGDIQIEGKNITIRMPETKITNFTIEDSDSSTYKYPDMNVDPMKWKKITNYVEKRIKQRVIKDGILKTAEKRGKEFIQSVLIESGWGNVSFSQ